MTLALRLVTHPLTKRSSLSFSSLLLSSHLISPFHRTLASTTTRNCYSTTPHVSPHPSPSPNTPPHSPSQQEQVTSKFIDEVFRKCSGVKVSIGNKFKACLSKEIEAIQQSKQDKDLVDDFFTLYQFQVNPTNPSILTKTFDGEEITIDFNDKRESILSQDLPDVLAFQVHITRNNTTMIFSCQRDYHESGETYSIKEIQVKDGTNQVKLLIQHLQDSTVATYTNFLYSRVPPSTPQVIDTLLNMRADQEYLSFLSLASQLFNK